MQDREIVFELLRSSVLGITPKIPTDAAIDWGKIISHSSEQGILSWVWDGIMKLPQEIQPSRFQKIGTELSVQKMLQRYDMQAAVLRKMIDVCEQYDVKLLLLKGIGLSKLYPNPRLRPSGDIDVYLGSDYKKGNELFCQEDYKFGGKHAEFTYEGVHIENHLTIINTITKKQRAIEHFIESDIDKAQKSADGYYVLEPMRNMVYLLVHTLGHMKSAFVVPYRNIVDFAMFLNENKSDLPPKECHDVLVTLGLQKSFELLLHLSEWILGINMAEYHQESIPLKDIDKAKKLLGDKLAKPEIPQSMPYLKQFVIRRRYENETHWMDKYLLKSGMDRFRSAFHIECAIIYRKLFHIPEDMLVADFFEKKKSAKK